TVVVLAVLLTAAAVSVTGPVDFVGLVAPVLVRLSGRWAPGVHRHRVLLPLSALVGVLVVVVSDVLLRMVLGGQGGVEIPTGVVTSLFGAVTLVAMARRFRDPGAANRSSPAGVSVRTRRRFVTVLAVLVAVT